MKQILNLALVALALIQTVFPAEQLLAQDNSRGVAVVDTTPAQASSDRFVVAVIGIDDYQYWPKLDNAVQDALGTANVLTEKFGFVTPIPPLLNKEATKAQIEHLVEDKLRSVLREDDNLVLLFAGHGHTRVDRVGNSDHETGYLVPVGAQVGSAEQWSQYIEIDALLKEISTLPARHILVVLDSCHSGFALSGAHKLRALPRYEQSLHRQVSRKVVTSARRDEQALDKGPIAGHSLFTGALVDGLDRSLADLDDSEFITSSEIGLYLQQTVGRHSDSRQTPDFGFFYLDDRGEMVIPIAIGNTLDALKRRAFSALKRGEFVELERILSKVRRQDYTGPQLQYLEYRQNLAKRQTETAYLNITDLKEMDWSEGTIPLSRHDVRELVVRARFWQAFLNLPEGGFPLEVTFTAGADAQHLQPVKPIKVGGSTGYEIGSGEYIQLQITNPTSDTWHVYMIDIDQDGRLNPIPLWQSDTQFEGLAGGLTEGSYTFKHGDSGPGVSEFRLFASRKRIHELLSPPSTAARGVLSPLDESYAAGVKVKSLIYRAVPRDVRVGVGNP